MIISHNLFLSKFNDLKNEISIPVVEQQENFQYTVLFGIVLPNQIPTKFVEFIYDCFKHLDFFVEFHFLTTDGLRRCNLGEMHNIIQNFKFFKNLQDFKNEFAKTDENFSLIVLIALQDYEEAGVYCCNLTQGDWYNNLKKVVYDTFK